MPLISRHLQAYTQVTSLESRVGCIPAIAGRILSPCCAWISNTPLGAGGRPHKEKKIKFRAAKGKLLTTVVVFGVGIAIASSVHFKSGPTFFDNGLTLTAAGSLAGLGNADVLVSLSATATPTATCTN